MRKAIFRKLKQNNGESFAEILAASVVISLGMILLVTMISTSVKIIRRSEKTFDDYFEAKNKFVRGDYSSETSETVTISTDVVTGFNINIPVKAEIKFASSDDGKYTFSSFTYKK